MSIFLLLLTLPSPTGSEKSGSLLSKTSAKNGSVGAPARAASEHRVEVERRRAGAGRHQRVLGHTELRGLIERDVVIGELADERRPGRHRRVVRVRPVGIVRRRAAVDRRVDDERFRPGAQLVAGVHDPAGAAEVQQRGPDLVARLGKRRQSREDPPKLNAPGRSSLAGACVEPRGERAGGGIGGRRPRPYRSRYEPCPRGANPFKNLRRDERPRPEPLPLPTPT